MTDVQIILPACSDDEISEGLRSLVKALHKRGEDLVRGFLGGEYGYGCHFENDTFSMFPFYWGDCTCGYLEREEKWSNEHPHKNDCPWSDWENVEPGKLRCLCGHDKTWKAWFQADGGHTENCLLEKPNFFHKKSGLKIRWYKYIGRDMEIDGESDFREILSDCLRSISH